MIKAASVGKGMVIRMTRGNQKKIAVINDMTGFGRCSLTVSIPIISAMQVQCCPLPTAFFSNHTAYPSFYKQDQTEQMSCVMEEWEKLGLKFDGILAGYLGSERQIDLVGQFIDRFSDDRTEIIVDPVMGDNGNIYSSYKEEMCRRMGELAERADLLTPNLTECCILTGREYRSDMSRAEILDMGQELLGRMAATGRCKSIVISGISTEKTFTNLCLTEGEEPVWLRNRKVGTERCGTGDVFAAMLAADRVKGTPLTESVRKAAAFIGKCIRRSEELEIPETDGICFEEYLRILC